MSSSDSNLDEYTPLSPLENLGRKLWSQRIRGVLLVITSAVILSLLFIIPKVIPEALAFPGFILAIAIFFGGAVILSMSTMMKRYIRGVKILQRLSPPEPLITEKYSTTKYENVFVFIMKRAPDMLYFVAFNQTYPTSDSKISSQRNFWKWGSVVHLEGLRVQNKRGDFSVPSPDHNIVSGEGLLLAVPISNRAYIIHVPEFSRSQLMAVVEYASRSVSGDDLTHLV